MPLFECFCSNCTKKFEILKRTEKEGRPNCPKCSSKNTKQLFSGFAAPGSSKTGGGFTPKEIVRHANLNRNK